MQRNWLRRVSQSINDWATNEFRNSVRNLRRSLVIALIGSLVIVVGAILFRALVKESSITQHVVGYGERHPKIVSRLGKPLKVTGPVSGIASYSLWHGRHIARVQIPVSGPNGDGVLFVYAVKPEDSWDMIEFVLGHEDEYWDILEGASVDGEKFEKHWQRRMPRAR